MVSRPAMHANLNLTPAPPETGLDDATSRRAETIANLRDDDDARSRVGRRRPDDRGSSSVKFFAPLIAGNRVQRRTGSTARRTKQHGVPRGSSCTYARARAPAPPGARPGPECRGDLQQHTGTGGAF